MCLSMGCGSIGSLDYQQFQVDHDTARKLAAAGPRDVISVRVTGQTRYTADYEVSLDGSINFPDLGRVGVAGKSKREIEDSIREGLEPDYLR